MSGFEVAGLVFGIIPVLFETCKAFRATRDKIYVFRFYSKEVNTVKKLLVVQEQIFLNYCELLLSLVQSDAQVRGNMLEDLMHKAWQDKELDTRLGSALKGSYEACKNVVEQCKLVLEEFEKNLGCFDVLGIGVKGAQKKVSLSKGGQFTMLKAFLRFRSLENYSRQCYLGLDKAL